MKKVEVDGEKRRFFPARSPLVEAVAARLRFVAAVVRLEPSIPSGDLRLLSGGHSVAAVDLSRVLPEPGEAEQERRAYRAFVRLATDDPSWFQAALEWTLETFANRPEQFAPRNGDSIVIEVLDWLVEREGDPKSEAARVILLDWIRSRMTDAAFCKGRSIKLAYLRRAIETYSRAIGERIDTMLAEDRPYGAQVVIGAEAIATETRRSTAGALRLIEGGKLPVAHLAGEVVSTRDLLRPHRRYVTALAA